jgi:outer membrane protein
LTLTQPLLRGAGIKVNRAAIDKAKIATTAAEAAKLATAQQLARDLIAAYWEVSFAHRDLANRRRSVDSVRQQLDRTEKMVRAGKRSRIEAKAIEQALAAREAAVGQAENALLEASLTLRTRMGQSLAGVDALGVEPTTVPDVQPRRIVIDDEVDRALSVNPRIKQIEHQLAGLRIDQRVAANMRLPKLDAAASFTPQGRSVESLGNPAMGIAPRPASWGQAFRNMFNDDVGKNGLLADWTLTGSITLTWDVQNRGARGARQQAKLAVEQTALQLEQARQQVVAGVIIAANRLRTASKTIVAARVSEELARENLAAEQAKFELGRATNYDVLLRLDQVDEAAAATLRAQVDYLIALADLQANNGEILPAYGLAR